MRRCLTNFSLLLAGLLAVGVARAAEEAQLVDRINAYRADPQGCAGQPEAVGPLSADLRLSAPTATDVGALQQALSQTGYQAAALHLLRLSGPDSVEAAMGALQQKFCRQLLGVQYTDIGVSRSASDWRIVLARPLLSGGLDDWQAAGQAVLEQVNAARAQPRQCGRESFAAAPPLAWNALLGEAALAHSRDMANGNFFSHRGSDASQPEERALRAGYTWSRLGENIAAGEGSPTGTVDGWLASPAHCANLMNPAFTEMGAAYGVDPRSDAGIYWTQVFGAP
ncbi:CAP domain-containing protein [Pseudomonas sp. RIT-PI-AD]|uniref:CAP domain-containing protein n=1 Tax=Pseudomonas sp. RIT-PI-AD TaxID=3035294 RepID=UPI0021DA7BE8|nr:CAP domain-containing protein [Pseudomonas sp. RIT-PI-AD]